MLLRKKGGTNCDAANAIISKLDCNTIFISEFELNENVRKRDI